MNDFFKDLLNDTWFTKSATIIVGITAIWLLVRVFRRNLLTRIKDNNNRYHANKFSGFAGYFFSAILLLVVFRSNLGGLSMAVGVAGAGIAFALQEVIASFAGWLAILFGGFYKTGDRVELGGITGDVMDIGVLRTTIMETGKWVKGDLYNGRIVLVANSFVFKEPVFNYSGDFPFLWDEINLPIQYGSDYEKVKAILLAAGDKIVGDLPVSSEKKWQSLQNRYRLEDARTGPQVSLVVTDNWVEFTLRYVVDYKLRRSTKTNLFTFILKEIEASEGKVKIASATLQIVD